MLARGRRRDRCYDYMNVFLLLLFCYRCIYHTAQQMNESRRRLMRMCIAVASATKIYHRHWQILIKYNRISLSYLQHLQFKL